jgi:hypothetical protein
MQGALNYRLADTGGKPHTSGETAGKLTVYIVTSANCPIAAKYRPVLDRLRGQYPAVEFFAVVPGNLPPPEQTFPVLLDPRFEVSRQLNAEMTPEAFVFDKQGKLRYRGRIDDRYVDFGKARPEPTQEDLRFALDDLEAGRPVKVTRRRGVGCFVEYGAR